MLATPEGLLERVHRSEPMIFAVHRFFFLPLTDEVSASLIVIS